MDLVAHDYVRLSLAIGEKEPGYIDAYYGPPQYQAEATAGAAAQSLEQLAARVATLSARLQALEARPDGFDQRRLRFLKAQLTAAHTRLRMLRGETLSFEEEAFGLFGVRPALRPLAEFDPVLARIEALMPGSGDLADRVESFANRFTVSAERLKPVFDAAIGECRARTLTHIAMPANERFEMAFVTGKSWSGYNYYLGDYKSRIEINTDLPIRISRAVDLGCHEGYPGHHVFNALLEQRLVKQRGWVEFSVYPLYSPLSLIAEGSANYGIELAFPGPERIQYEIRSLYPLAGIASGEAAKYLELLDAMKSLASARFTIASELLAGRIDDAEAVRLTRRYQLVSEPRAKQSVAFIRQYRSYVINYGLGEAMVRADIEAAGPSPQARWRRMEQILSEPTLPSDLRFLP